MEHHPNKITFLQPGPSKLDSHAWLEEEERRTSAKKAFLATKRSINPLEPVYQLPDGGSTIPAGTDGMVRTQNFLALSAVGFKRLHQVFAPFLNEVINEDEHN